MVSFSLSLLVVVVVLWISTCPAYSTSVFGARMTAAPTAKTVNGTYQGLYNAQYDQDFFLGIPFAQPPVGDLRLNIPKGLNSSFGGIKQAVNYPPDCPSNGTDDKFPGITLSEDCLALNIIRASGTNTSANLPVAVWIYGGGYFNGGSRDPRYNLSRFIENSVTMGTPIIGVNLNYRVAGFGFLYSKEVQQAGVTNLGLRDQRLALHWIQENIAAFGGDPKKVTIWGESAGAGSVGHHTTAYAGRDDKLFRGVIAESGGPLMFQPPNTTFAQSAYDSIVRATNCTSSSNTLSCLRHAPYKTLFSAINTISTDVWSPVVDSDFLPLRSSLLLASGNFTRTALLIGANTAEGTAFHQAGINSDADFTAYLAATGFSPAQRTALSTLYPDIPALGIPPTLTARPNSTYGLQYHRACAIGGDIAMHRGRRLSASSFSAADVPVYSYRFNLFPIGGVDNLVGTTHFQDVAFVYDNTAGMGYVPPHATANPYDVGGGLRSDYEELGRAMSGMWINFIHSLDPNGADGRGFTVQRGSGSSSNNTTGSAAEKVPLWPVYSDGVNAAREGYGQNFVFDVNVTGFGVVEEDSYRGNGIAFLNSEAVQEIFGT